MTPSKTPSREPVLLDDQPDRVALVTGATGGIGRAIVADLVGRGWAVLATDLGPGAHFGETDDRVRYVQADVTDAHAMVAATRAAEQLGTLRGCIANAGVATERFSPFVDASPEAWLSTLSINVLGTLNTFQAAAAAMLRSSGGRMAATASVAGIRAQSDVIVYSTSKAAVVSIVKSLALELGSANVSVNAVAPGPVSTDFQRSLIRERDLGEERGGGDAFGGRYQRFRNENRPFSRMATPEEVAGTFGWLLSDAAAYMTGQVLVLDGGGVLV